MAEQSVYSARVEYAFDVERSVDVYRLDVRVAGKGVGIDFEAGILASELAAKLRALADAVEGEGS